MVLIMRIYFNILFFIKNLFYLFYFILFYFILFYFKNFFFGNTKKIWKKIKKIFFNKSKLNIK